MLNDKTLFKKFLTPNKLYPYSDKCHRECRVNASKFGIIFNKSMKIKGSATISVAALSFPYKHQKTPANLKYAWSFNASFTSFPDLETIFVRLKNLPRQLRTSELLLSIK